MEKLLPLYKTHSIFEYAILNIFDFLTLNVTFFMDSCNQLSQADDVMHLVNNIISRVVSSKNVNYCCAGQLAILIWCFLLELRPEWFQFFPDYFVALLPNCAGIVTIASFCQFLWLEKISVCTSRIMLRYHIILKTSSAFFIELIWNEVSTYFTNI